MKVAKFGGSSLSDWEHFKKVIDIICADDERRFVIASAPGKRNDDDIKVTDLLYACYNEKTAGRSFDDIFKKISDRFFGIINESGVNFDLQPYLDEIYDGIIKSATPDYAASRGEYLNSLLLAACIGWDFIDAADIIKFYPDGMFDSDTTQMLVSSKLHNKKHYVIPGFYGSLPNGEIKTFSRGGSDITGAIIARGVSADLYENWTDVSGFHMADPRIVPNAKIIEYITYRELRELSYMGATVLHEDAIFPVRKAGIPTTIKNTNQPQAPGTRIVFTPPRASTAPDKSITGIAGRKGFMIIAVEKAMMNSEMGFGRRVLQALEKYDVSFEHLPTGIDTMCVIVNEKAMDGKRDEILSAISAAVTPDSIEIITDLAMIATVGRGMINARGTAARLFGALYSANINVRMIDQGSSELNIIVGVHADDFEKAVKAIYDTFVED